MYLMESPLVVANSEQFNALENINTIPRDMSSLSITM